MTTEAQRAATRERVRRYRELHKCVTETPQDVTPIVTLETVTPAPDVTPNVTPRNAPGIPPAVLDYVRAHPELPPNLTGAWRERCGEYYDETIPDPRPWTSIVGTPLMIACQFRPVEDYGK